VEVLRGLEPGERVVTEGAYYVRLAAAASGEIGHGHTH
jgi:membrane fusion protein, heavy metal efflux system